MANADLIGRIFSSRVVKGVMSMAPYINYATDYSSELTHGKGLVLPVQDDALTVRDWTEGAELQYEAPTANSLNLDVDKFKYIAFEQGDLTSAALRFDQLAQAGVSAGGKLGIEVASELQAKLAAIVPEAATSFTVKLADIKKPTAAERTKIREAVLATKSALKKEGYTQDVIVAAPSSVYNSLLTEDVAVGSARSDKIKTSGTLGGYYGVTLFEDVTGPGENIHMFLSGRTLGYISRPRRTEMMRSPKKFATLWRSLIQFGVKVKDTKAYGRVKLN